MKFTLLLLACGFVAHAQTQSDSTKRYTTAWVQGAPPVIDGLLNDDAWEQVEWAGGDFRQVNPDKGKPASVQTKFKILYDDKNLYAIFRCYDPEPEKIVKRMSRRDSFDGDWVEIHIDSYYDKRTAFSFTSSVSGVKSDEYVSNNGDDWDASWDPIWYMKTSVDKEGWIAEIRIPLSQLRFTNKEELVWGLNVQRRFFRNQENSRWQYIPPDAAGYVHLMGEMNGIKGIKPQKQLEIQPYIVTKAETFQKEEGNPYATGQSTSADVGLDAKIGITSDITLDLTVNPDFGQVEADPSQVNLSAFELYFREQRPFFTEGANTLDFSLAFNESNLFYSRRVGRQPQGWVDTDRSGADDVNEYVRPVNRTKILGAAKLSGKNKKGFSWALMESITAREYAEIDSLGRKRQEEVEPLTNYFVMRAQQDFNNANTVVGGMFTATNRQLKNPNLNWLRQSAYSGGVDVLHHWKKRMYYVNAKGMFSHVTGSTEAIAATQRSSVRFFQRPDNRHTEFDATRKSLTGTGGQVVIGKKSGNLVSDLGVVWQSPELELNDVGFMPQTDIISQWFWMQYRILKPKGITRAQRYNINEWREYDFGGRNLNEGYNVNAHAEFKNFWQAGAGVTYRVRAASNNDLRGGPTLRYPGRVYYWGYVNTDHRKKFYASLTPELGLGSEHFSRSLFMQLRLTWRPTNALNLSVAPSFSRNENEMQYVATAEVNGEPRYIVARIDQNTVRMVIRATYMLTPNLSIQYYGQPFGTAGRYSNYKSITNANAAEYAGRFVSVNPVLNTDTYWVDDNNDTVQDYSFGKPDFNFGQFRSNMVMRWEYIPGSTFFLVWTRERNGAFYDSHPDHKSYSFDFDQKGHNIFLMKFTYRFRA
ncbi:MAG: carbohydrate binding family 9 domain-containing protein [Cyclobacteriaceae bacterium]|nr:carbohydrate binding family 9 domain-containing protein [Cyclobacteriaceae bacterium]